MSSKKQYNYCVFIGRMQPPHKAHIRNIQTALDLAEKAIVIFGSHRAARNIKNPWTAEEREQMVRACLPAHQQDRLIFLSVRDYYYNDNIWVADIQQRVNDVTEENAKIALLGMHKDHSSYYLDLFPQWAREHVSEHQLVLNATDVRNAYFDADNKSDVIADTVDKPAAHFLQSWATTTHAPIFNQLSEEWTFIQQYKKMWAQAPYPVTFTTTDAVVVKAGHVLMVKRKFNPGKGLLALPGGFLQQNITIQESAINELKEETRIRMPREDIAKHLKDSRVFDHPGRSLRGRTITHAFYFELPPNGDLPYVKGDDDAERAMWIPITELFARESEVYEDHLHIVNYFYSKPK